MPRFRINNDPAVLHFGIFGNLLVSVALLALYIVPVWAGALSEKHVRKNSEFSVTLVLWAATAAAILYFGVHHYTGND